MTYWTLNAIFLVPVAVIAIVAEVGPRRRARSTVARAGLDAGAASLSWRAVGLSAVILLLLTAVFDNVMIQMGFFGYNPDWISGVFVGVAPLEDFAYPLAAVVLLPALWTLFTPSATPATADRTHP